jgi:tetratricopeptide (TPR) repeat protein
VKFWNSKTAKLVAELSGDVAINQLALSEDGRYMASAGADGVIRIWEIETVVRARDAKPLYTFHGHTEPVTGVSFSRDGRRLASIALDRSMKLWDVASGQEVLSPRALSTDSSRVLFSPDGRFLAASHSFYVTVWDGAATGPESDQARGETDRAQVTAWHRRMAQEAETARQWFAAAFHLGHLIQAEPGHSELYRRRGAALAAGEQWHGSLADYQQAAQLLRDQASGSSDEPTYHQNLARSHFGIAYALNRIGDYADAAEQYRQALRIRPDFALAQNNFAWLLATCPDESQRNIAEALERAERATELDKKRGIYWNTWGVALCRAGRWSEAIEKLEQSIQLQNGGDATDWYFLAIAHWHLKHESEARRWFDQAVEWTQRNKPDDPELQRFRAEAESLLVPESKP